VITVCLVQIVNTLQAGMRMNRRELWLYEVVGMSRSQKLRMQLIEHGLSAVTAYCLGLLISFLFSYLFVEKLLELGGAGFEYRWPLGVALVMGVILSALIIGVNLLEMHQFIQNREKPG
ncbi:MAG: ABC transporter permease, partial [Lachnospiraceae bacterium]|nr:ABC transporter permease [Lachnospiraceae bacterium]